MYPQDEQRRAHRIEQWIILDTNTKNQIKARIFQTLADPVKDARHTAAQVCLS